MDAIIDTVIDVVAVESELVRRDVGDGSEPKPEPSPEPGPGWEPLRIPPLMDWTLYCGGEIVRTAYGDGASYRRQLAKQSNCQTYTILGIAPGHYRLSFDVSGSPEFSFGVALHQHNPPRVNLGLDVQVASNAGRYSAEFDVAYGDTAARLRIWVGDIPAGGVLEIENFILEGVG
jgi:hypothetical protein